MSKLPRSAAAFAKIVARSSVIGVARELNRSESTIRSWANGTRTPNEEWRDRLHAWDARLAVDGWRGAGAGAAVPSAPVPRPLPVPRVPAAGGEDGLLEVIRQCNDLYEAAQDPERHATVRDMTAILAAKSAAVVRLSKVRGEDAVSLRKILESKPWRAIVAVLDEALRGITPDRLAAIATRLRALEAEGR